MERTEIFELTTEADVLEFCQHLLDAKGLAPVSLSCTVAPTVRRDVRVVPLFDPEEHKRGPIGTAFRRLVGGDG